MEEADALCGRIGIMAYGSLRCLGPSLHLKRRFGDGFRVEVTHREGGAEAARQFLAEVLPDANTAHDDEENGASTIVLQLRSSVKLSEVFARMEARPQSNPNKCETMDQLESLRR